ncbi:hypothetical protein O6H91_18G059600 [Diphasiastrum complanatum]|uniref:Uncharacterized protein n=2 Tax=Diphasiastrum complanatum TaxID=34168 RepID=A0ACC2B2T8_DIPCM|nr:hypothetical protein O6H91_18G059600 [Diphasiastrum complanatum]KAJ7523713.1 hypothetical protein O6H91_18G059600 [Diphasiastrum complanatum]
MQGVLKKQRRERIRDKAIRRMKATPRRIIPKSETTKEHLRKILGNNFLFGDLDVALREEMIDAFQDDVGEFDILAKRGNEPPILLTSKGAGECFGELALMYDNLRNATVKAKTHALLWAVDRATFKSIMSRHLSGSPRAQILREAPSFKRLSSREIVHLSNHCNVESFSRGQHILKAGSCMDKVYIIQEGQVRVTWGPLGNDSVVGKATSTHGICGETVAVMNRLEIIGEALLLNEEPVSLWDYIASSEKTSIIAIDRSLFHSEMLKSIRKELQMQLITLALQRVPAFLELNADQLCRLASTFTESFYSTRQAITRSGEVLGSEGRLYVVQEGYVCLSTAEDSEISPYTAQAQIVREGQKTSTKDSSAGVSATVSSWGCRFGSFLRNKSSGGSTLHSPRSSILDADFSQSHGLLKGPNISKAFKSAETSICGDRKTYKGVRQGGSPRRSIGSSAPWSITTYGIFGDECLLSRPKDENFCTPYQTTAVAESIGGTICLSTTIAQATAVLGPIQDFLMYLANSKVLRKVPCLEHLTSAELEMISHSMGIRKVAPGEFIYQAGEAADCLYIVSKGTALESPTEGGRATGEHIILSKGSYFGEEALLSDEPRSTAMVAGKEDPSGPGGAELFYLDRAVLEANLGPLQEIIELRRQENEKRGIVKTIALEDLHEIGLLGIGLFGKVKLVFCKRTEEYYALKCVSKAKVIRMQEEDHLRNEKLNMSELDHPFIIRLIRTYKDAKNVYLLQELTTGRELFLHMEKRGRLQQWEAAFYAGGVLLALEYMHGKGIVYRDLKPENTLIGDNGYPKLIDMGFAKKIYNRRTYSMCGTPDYMAPELIKRQGHGKAVDYWALGCMIFEMITNMSPFNRGDDPPQLVFKRILEGRMRFPTYVSPDAVDLIKKLLEPIPEARLGCQRRGTLDIKEHPFFKKQINFQLLIRQKEEPPMIPPKITDFSSLCIRDEPPDANDNLIVVPPPEHKAWDDIF